MSKIKINQEEYASTMFQMFLSLHRYAAKRWPRWLFFTAFIFISWGWWKTPFFVIWWLPVVVVTVVVFYGDWADRKRNQQLQQLNELKIDRVVWQQFEQCYPQVSFKHRRLIEQGFKDYWALHILRKQAYAMPSHAVDALWHIFLEYPELYRQFCLQSLGRVVQHQPYTAHSSPQEQQQQLYAAWQYSCRLHGLNPQHATHLPRLFAIDQLLQWPQGQTFVLEQIQQDYVQYLKSQSSSSSSSSSCSSGCSSCGGD